MIFPGLGGFLARDATPRVLTMQNSGASAIGAGTTGFTTAGFVIPGGCDVVSVSITGVETVSDFAAYTATSLTINGQAATQTAIARDPNSGDANQLITVMFRLFNPAPGTGSIVYLGSNALNAGYTWAALAIQNENTLETSGTASVAAAGGTPVLTTARPAIIHGVGIGNVATAMTCANLPNTILSTSPSAARSVLHAYAIEPAAVAAKNYTFLVAAANRFDAVVSAYSKT